MNWKTGMVKQMIIKIKSKSKMLSRFELKSELSVRKILISTFESRNRHIQ